jgi:hypothetical protein
VCEKQSSAAGMNSSKAACSSVVNHASGILQLEYRSNPKTGTRRGPYWYFYWPEDGKQHSLYVGKTSDPEALLEEKLARQDPLVKIGQTRAEKLSPLLTLGRSGRL